MVCNCFCLIGFSSLLATCGRRGGFDDGALDVNSKASGLMIRICEHSTVQMLHAFLRCNFSCRHLGCIRIPL